MQEPLRTARVEARRGGQTPTRQTITLTYKTISQSLTGSIRFTVSKFRHCLTLFSKSFSPFPHGTCSLSVSCQYLALEGIYLPLRAAFPNNPTLRRRAVKQQGHIRRGPHPLRRYLPVTLGTCLLQIAPLQNTTPCGNHKASHPGLFPVHSPLLGESSLVSSPPLIDMLKFSG